MNKQKILSQLVENVEVELKKIKANVKIVSNNNFLFAFCLKLNTDKF